MSDKRGSYKLMAERGFRVGITAFTLPKNAIVTVTQQDDFHNKVLVEFGPSTLDWMSDSILKDFERLD